MVNRYGIVTPEAVLLDLPAAGIATRIGAKVVDLLLMAVVFGLGTAVGALLGSLFGSTTSEVLLLLWVFFVLLILPFLCEGLWNGRTPGKALFRLRAVTLDGGPVTWRHCFVRGVAQPVDIYAALGIVPALATRRSQRFGDLMAGTFVLVEPPPQHSARPIAFFPPPGWERFVAALDVGRVRPEQYRLTRSFLLRVNELEANARWHLATRLADGLQQRVSPAPYPGMPPETYLICVASAYQIRNGGLPDASQVMWQAMPAR